MMLTAMPQYDTYKDSGVEWMGDIPDHWHVIRLKNAALINPVSNISKLHLDDEICFLPMEKVGTDGIVEYDLRRSLRSVKQGFTSFQVNDVLIAKITPCFENGKGAYLKNMPTKFGYGSTEFHVLRAYESFEPAFLYYLSKSHVFMDLGEKMMTGSAGQKRVPTDFIAEFRFASPSFVEQKVISSFLDKKTTQIDEAITIKARQIVLLNERKQILIQQAVTQGLDPTVPMTDSGVTWIGKIPAHWEVRRSKFVFCQRKERARAGDVQLSATQAYGVIPQEQYEGMIGRKVVKISFHLEKRKHVEIDDFVISMRSFQGGLERAWASGCIRSSYVVLRPVNKEEIDAGFFSYMLKLPTYINALQMTASFIRDGQDLNFDNFAQVDLFIPPIEEQKAIFSAIQSKVDGINKSIVLLMEQITKYQEYKTTLINSAVTGKIKVV